MRMLPFAIGMVVMCGLLACGCVDTTPDSTTDVPSTTQPAAVTGPAYHATLVDPLYESTAGAKAVASGDIDNDGMTDFASISSESQRVQIHLQRGLTGEFDTIAVAGGAPITKPTALQLADLNGDGKLDIVVLVADTGFANDGDPQGTLAMLFQGADPRNVADWVQLPTAGSSPPSNLAFPAGDGVADGATALLVGPIDGWSGVDIVVLSNGGEEFNEVRFYSNPSGAAAMNASAWTSTVIEADLPALLGAVLGDIDGDGDLDVAMNAPESKSFNLRWLENPLIGSGTSNSDVPTYSPNQYGTLFEATARAKTVVLGDINSDGFVDAASTSDIYQPVQIHLWDTELDMFHTVSITSGPPVTQISDLALTDLDGDGKLDIVLLASSTGLVADSEQPALVLLFQGDDPAEPDNWTVVPGATGTFPVNMLLGAGPVSDLTIGDVDGLNGADIVVTGKGAVRLFNNPGGALGRVATNWTSSILETNAADNAKVELVDLDDDGDDDVVMADPGGSGFNVRFLQNPRIIPDGTNLSETPTYLSDLVRPDLIDALFESTAGAKAVDIGDIDGDGELDVASISDENQTVQVHLKNTATGMFDAAVTIAGGGPLARMVDIELTDLNNDDKLDIAVLVNDTGFAPPDNTSIVKVGALVVLLQGADPTDPSDWTQVDFRDDPRMPVTDRAFYLQANSTGPTDMVTGDFDGDGLVDIVVTSNEVHDVSPTTFVYLMRNPGLADVGDAGSWNREIIDSDNPDYSRLDVGDIDEDGDLDVVASVPTSKSFNLRWLENSNNANDWTDRFLGQQQGGGEVVALGDVDGDGHLDLAAASATQMLTQWFRNPGPQALGTGAQFPWEVFNIGELPEVPGKINQVQLVDLDADNELDCFVTAYDEAGEIGTVIGFRRKADVQEGWESFQIDSAEAEFGRVAFADFDDNGRLDFLAPINHPGLTNDRIAFYTSVPDSRWLRGVVGQQADGADHMAVGDVDSDGNPDVAVASVANGLVQWFKNPGADSLTPGESQVPWRLFTIGESSGLGGDVGQVELLDLDGDDAVECFVTAGSTLAAFYQQGSAENEWSVSIIDQSDATLGRVTFAYIDSDSYVDFIVPLDREGSANDTIAIYTVLAQDRWRRRLVGQQPGSVGVVAAADIDGDGNLDVASVTGSLTQWYRNPGSALLQSPGVQVPWDVFNIGQLTEGEPDQIQLVDLDSNGVFHCFISADGVAWQFTPQSDIENFWTPSQLFTTDPLADIGRAAFADFNGDGWLDMVVPVDRVDALVRDQFILLTRK